MTETAPPAKLLPNEPGFSVDIRVEQHHIDSGLQRNCDHCPIAIAVRQYFEFTYGRTYRAQAGNLTVTVSEYMDATDDRVVYAHNGWDFINAFDSRVDEVRAKVAPFTVTLTFWEAI